MTKFRKPRKSRTVRKFRYNKTRNNKNKSTKKQLYPLIKGGEGEDLPREPDMNLEHWRCDYDRDNYLFKFTYLGDKSVVPVPRRKSYNFVSLKENLEGQITNERAFHQFFSDLCFSTFDNISDIKYWRKLVIVGEYLEIRNQFGQMALLLQGTTHYATIGHELSRTIEYYLQYLTIQTLKTAQGRFKLKMEYHLNKSMERWNWSGDTRSFTR